MSHDCSKGPFWFSSTDSVEDELEMATVRHRPEALELLEAQSKFTKKELQILYRGFKNVRTFFLALPSSSSQRSIEKREGKRENTHFFEGSVTRTFSTNFS